MDYTLYTTVDITNTGQYRAEHGKEHLRWKEQNFQTVLQTIGIRANISYKTGPEMLEAPGSKFGFNTDNVIRIWRFNFKTEQDNLFEMEGNPTGALKIDFDAIPFISGLDECMKQSHDVFVTVGAATNIVFFEKQ